MTTTTTNEQPTHFRLQLEGCEAAPEDELAVPAGKGASARRGWILVLLVGASLVLQFATFLVLMFADQSDVCRKTMGIYKFLPRRISEASFAELEFSPPAWFFRVAWYTSTILQMIWLAYYLYFTLRSQGFIKIGRKPLVSEKYSNCVEETDPGAVVHKDYKYLNIILFAALSVSTIELALWIYFYSNDRVRPSFLTLSNLSLTMFVCAFIFFVKTNSLKVKFRKSKILVEVWLLQVLGLNCLAFYLAWLVFVTKLNLALFLAQDVGVHTFQSSVVSLAAFAAALIVYSIVENLKWRDRFMYIFAPWPVFVLATGLSLLTNWKRVRQEDESNPPTHLSIYMLVLFILAVLGSMAKLNTFLSYHLKLRKRLDKLRQREDEADRSSSSET